MHLDLSEKAIDFLIEKGHNEDYGARPLRRAIERFIEDPLAEQILRSTFVDEIPIKVDVDKEGEALDFEQPKGEQAAPAAAATADDN